MIHWQPYAIFYTIHHDTKFMQIFETIQKHTISNIGITKNRTETTLLVGYFYEMYERELNVQKNLLE